MNVADWNGPVPKGMANKYWDVFRLKKLHAFFPNALKNQGDSVQAIHSKSVLKSANRVVRFNKDPREDGFPPRVFVRE